MIKITYQTFIAAILLAIISSSHVFADVNIIPPEPNEKKAGVIMTSIGSGLLVTGGLSIYATHYLNRDGPYPMTYDETVSESRRHVYSLLTGIYAVVGTGAGIVSTSIGVVKLVKYRRLQKKYDKSSFSFQVSPNSVSFQVDF